MGAPAVLSPPVASAEEVRRGLVHWLRSYRRMISFDLATHRVNLSALFFIQIMMGLVTALVYGLYVPHMPTLSAEYVTTGAPTLALVPVGLVMMPALIAQQRTLGTYDFVWSLPVPRSAASLSTLTVFTAVALPGAALTGWLVSLRYGVALSPSPTLVPAVLLVSLMTSSVGFSLAHLVKNQLLINVIGNALIFLATLFTPVAFPASHYPSWLVEIDQYLPLYPMATVLRNALVPGLAPGLERSYLVLGVWTVMSWATAAWTVGRRP